MLCVIRLEGGAVKIKIDMGVGIEGGKTTSRYEQAAFSNEKSPQDKAQYCVWPVYVFFHNSVFAIK